MQHYGYWYLGAKAPGVISTDDAGKSKHSLNWPNFMQKCYIHCEKFEKKDKIIIWKKWPSCLQGKNFQPFHTSYTWKLDQYRGYWCPGSLHFQDISIHSTDRTLRWRHNGRDGVPNYQPHNCLLNRLFWRRSKKTSKLRVTGLCAGNSPVTGKFSTQMASIRKMFPFDDIIMITRAVRDCLIRPFASISECLVSWLCLG